MNQTFKKTIYKHITYWKDTQRNKHVLPSFYDLEYTYKFWKTHKMKITTIHSLNDKTKGKGLKNPE